MTASASRQPCATASSRLNGPADDHATFYGVPPDQINRVQHLMAIDAGMGTIKDDAVGEWMVAGNGSGVTSGASPVDFLTRAGTSGYAALARQVGIWVRM
jgi:hypothetical protein